MKVYKICSRIGEVLFDMPKSWSARGIEKSKKKAIDCSHKYSVHINKLNTKQLFKLIAMNNIENGIELFGFGLAKIEERFYLYDWNPDDMYSSNLDKLCLYRLSEDFTDKMADELSHWIVRKEIVGICSGRVWPLFASVSENSPAKYEGIIVFGTDKSSVHKYKKVYDKLILGRDALPIESSDIYTKDISEIPNKFQMCSWLSVNLTPEEIMSLGIGRKDIMDETLGVTLNEIL